MTFLSHSEASLSHSKTAIVGWSLTLDWHLVSATDKD